MLQRQSNVLYIFVAGVYETPPQHSLQNEVSQLMRDSEIRGSADPLSVIQKTREKQNEELILLTLTVPQTEEIEEKIQLLLQRHKQLELSSRIIMQIHLELYNI